jgi:tetratricopeptide (TPR) repeat protein
MVQMGPRTSRSWWRDAALPALLLLCLALPIGCVRAAGPPEAPSPVLTSVRAAGLDLEDPLGVSAQTMAEVAKALSTVTSVSEKLKGLRDLLYTASGRPFEYAPHLTLTAERAYRERRGDCLAFSMLFASLARGLGVPVHFVHVRDVESYYERGGELFVSSHVAVGYGVGPSARIYDFKREITDWRLSLYRPIDDDGARALYYNNVAVDWMLAGRYDESGRLFRVLVERAPGVAEPIVNHGVLLTRRGEHAEALRVLEVGIERFPDYKPLYTNAIVTADALGRRDVVARLDAAVDRLTHEDPIHVFGRGMRFLNKGAYEAAVKELSRAHEAMPDSAVVLAGLGRAHIGAGDIAKGTAALEAAKEKAAAPLRRQLEDKLDRVRRLGRTAGSTSRN